MKRMLSSRELNERGRLFLEAALGEISVTDACGKLGITRQRYYELEERAVEEFLRALEPRAPGRPAKEVDPTVALDARIADLQKENQNLWLYIKVLRRMAGVPDREKTRTRPSGSVAWRTNAWSLRRLGSSRGWAAIWDRFWRRSGFRLGRTSAG